MNALDTLPKHLLDAASGPNAGDVAFRLKHLGCWAPTTWSEYGEKVKEVYFGLHDLGFRQGGIVAMIAENSPEWLFVDLAAQSTRGLMAAMFAESMEPEIRYVVSHTKAEIIVVGDQEQADKVLPLTDLGIRHVIVVDPRGMEEYNDPRILRFDQLLEMGRIAAGSDGDARFAEAVSRTEPADDAALLYTSGTTGKPKGALLTQRTAVSAGKGVREIEGLTGDEELISYLPFAWVGERMFSVFYHLVVRYKVNFPEDLDMGVVLSNWREIQPSFILAPPRIWEQLTSRVYIGIDNTTRLKRTVFNLLMPASQRVAEARLIGKKPILRDRMMWAVGNVLLYRWIRERLGLVNAEIALTGGAALGPEVVVFFRGLGVELRQVYGQSESAGIAVIQRRGEARSESVGRLLPGMEVRITEDSGEVQLKGELVFDRYLDDPEATEKAFDDGWLRTGDQGYLAEDGQLAIIDRMKDVCVTTAGDSFSPQLLENKIKFSRFVRDAVVLGNEKPYVAAMLQIDFDNVGNWAQRHGLSYTTFSDLAQNDAVRSLIEEEVNAVSRALPAGLQIKKFVLLTKELDADDEEVTRTTKIKRSVIERKYAEQIVSLYGESNRPNQSREVTA